MKVERYQEDDMRKAMAKVRSELGKDAVLISSRRVNGRAEIVAASACDPQQLEAEIKKLSATKSPRSSEQPHRDYLFEILSDENEDEAEQLPSILDIQDELGRLRKLFEGELAQLAWRDAGSRQPNRMALLARLEAVGISRDIGAKIMEKILPCDEIELGWRRTLRILGRAIKVSDQDVLKDGGVIAMLGPTGVGKTTTAAKIAAQFAMVHGRNQVAFITTDCIKVGGQEQLISLGSVLGIPVQIATDGNALQKTLESFSERKLVIIDTAGISQRETHLVQQFESLKNASIKISPFLVLSATTRESVINETIKAFSRVDLKAAIVTKTDEGGSIGAVLSGLIRNKLPTAFVGNGQRVPEDLVAAQADIFLNIIIASYEESRKQSGLRKFRARRRQALNV